MQPKLHIEIFANQAREHPLSFREDVVETQHARLQDLASAECQELPSERCGTLGRCPDVVEAPPYRQIDPWLLQAFFAIPQNHGEHIVEVVGNAGEAGPWHPFLRMQEFDSAPAPVTARASLNPAPITG